MIHSQGRQTIEADFLNQIELRLSQFFASFGPNLPGFHIHQVFGDETAKQFSAANQHFRRAGFGDFARHARGQLRVLFGHNFAGTRIHQRFGKLHTTEGIRVKGARPALGAARKYHLAIEGIEDFLGIHAADLMRLQRRCTFSALHFSGGAIQRIQQRGDRQLALAVNAHVANILGVEFEIKPGTAIGNNARGEKILAAAMRLALVMVEEHAGAAMHLGDNDAFSAIDDEGAVIGHERHIAHIDILFLDVAHRTAAGFLIHIPNDQA